ncbi:MAG: hypothetical protein IJS97_03000 [Prevotella sp.]|nr:hypothetical protein [Prevotella sp.]
MKKIFTLMIVLLATMSTYAQTIDPSFVFTDLQGNTINDGAVITVKEVNADGQLIVPLRVKNVSGEKRAASMYETLDDMPSGGSWQTCAFGNCVPLSASGYSSKNVCDPNYESGIETEWIPSEGQYASWSATLQIHIFNIVQETKFGQTRDVVGTQIIGYGPTVTVNFTYSDPASVNGIEAARETKVTAVYGADGRQRNGVQKGVNVVRLSDGSTRKIVEK